MLDALTLSVAKEVIHPESRARELCLGIGFLLRDLLTYADATRVFSLLRVSLCNLHCIGMLTPAPPR